MGSGVKKDALANSGTANTYSSNLMGNAGTLYGSLAPSLMSESAHPTGFTPQQKAEMNTDAMQSAGGSMAGAVGQGALQAGRTRNAGTADASIAQAARDSSKAATDSALKTNLADAQLQQQNKQAARSGLESLYGQNLGASLNALGLSNQALNTANNAKQSLWQQLGSQAAGNILNAFTSPGV